MPCPPLPLELWLSILEPMAEEIMTAKRSNRFRRPGYGALASVCRDWQEVFEPKIFGHLTLRRADMQEFLRNVREPRRKMVKHIWYIIEFNRYGCNQSQINPQDDLDRTPVPIFWHAMKNLFYILSLWPPPYARDDDGVTLELSMWSPSDNTHSFSDIDLGEADRLDSFPDVEEDFRRHTSSINKPAHGWISGSRSRAITTMEWQKLRHFINWDDFSELLSVGVVTSLLLRRQTRADLHVSSYKAIFTKLPNLASVHLEMWEEWEEARAMDKDAELASILGEALPPSIERVTLLYECSAAISDYYEFTDTKEIEVHDEFLACSLGVKHFNCSFVITANEFLEHYLFSIGFYNESLEVDEPEIPDAFEWTYLKEFTMTTPSLHPRAPSTDILQLVYAAGRAAVNMPGLKKLQLWDGDAGHAALLSFEVKSWDGIWEKPIFEYVPLQPWEEFVTDVLIMDKPIRFKTTKLEASLIKSRGDAMHFLGLGPDVVRPISVHQMRREAMTYAHA